MEGGAKTAVAETTTAPASPGAEQGRTVAPPAAGPPTVQPSLRASIAIGARGVELQTLDDLWRVANIVVKSNLAPKGIDTAEKAFVVLQLGMEVGLPIMASLQNIAPINGRPSIWGDAAVALCRQSGLMQEFDEWFDVGPKDKDGHGRRIKGNPDAYDDNTTAWCQTWRRGDPEAKFTSFSVADAKRAKLWGKEGPWTNYPQRQLKFRASGFRLRDSFGDVLKGLVTAEEAQDIPVGGDVKRVELSLAGALARAGTNVEDGVEVSTASDGDKTTTVSDKTTTAPPAEGAATLSDEAKLRAHLLGLATPLKYFDKGPPPDKTPCLWCKDQEIATEVGAELGARLPFHELTVDQMTKAVAYLEFVQREAEGKKGAAQGDLVGGGA